MTLRFITWDVAHGSAAYIRTPNGKQIAIDLGAQRSSESGFSPLLHLRRRWGVERLDAAVITHPHLDHIEDILNLDALDPKTLVRPPHLTEDDVWGTNRNASEETKRIIRKYIDVNKRYTGTITDELRLTPSNCGGASFQFFVPTSAPRDNVNNHSVVTVMVYEGVKFLLPGDNEPPSWHELLGMRDFLTAIQNTHVLVAPHHGRESGYHSPLFEKISPLLTIISDGRFVDTSATSRYSAKTKGWTVHSRKGGSVERKCVTTRNDGVIDVEVSPPARSSDRVGSLHITID